MGSNAGIVGMTKEHLGLALALNVPVFVVVTKIDMCPANILQGQFYEVPSSFRLVYGMQRVHALALYLDAVRLATLDIKINVFGSLLGCVYNPVVLPWSQQRH